MIEQKMFDRLSGSMFGRYRLEQYVEKNSYAPVFLAQIEGSSTKCLVRLLMPAAHLQGRNRDEYLASFQYKASQIAALQHPYLLPIVDYGVLRGIPFLVSPQISMRSLRTRLDKHVPMDALTAGRYLDQICTVLEYAHQQGFVHGNLSIDCIYLRLDGQILVANLGLASLLESYHETGQVNLQAIAGEGSAPEQLLGKPLGPFTDVYGLGAVLYHMLTASPVFSGNTFEEIAQQHLYASVPLLSQKRNDLPAGLYTIIVKAMAKNPAQRFYQPGAFANAYHRVADPRSRTRVPFIVNSSATLQQEEVVSMPGKEITGTAEGNNGLARSGAAESSLKMAMQTPFPIVSPSFSEGGLVDQRDARRTALQRRLGRRGLRLPTVIVAALLLILISGSVLGLIAFFHQGAAAASLAGQVTFFDSQNEMPWTTDSLSITVQGLKAPQAGYHYQGWLINNDNEQVTALGTLSQTAQNATLLYIEGSAGAMSGPNLLSPGDKVEVTLENGIPKQPVGTVVLSGVFPTKSFAHITHLLVNFPETPGQIGMMVGLVQQTHLLTIQGNALQELAASKDYTQISCTAQSILDIIEGSHGANYQALATTCPAQNALAGDGFGLLGNGFLAGTAEHATLAISQPDATPMMRQHAALMNIALSNIKAWATTLDQDALQLRNTPTNLAQVNAMTQLADAVYYGVDVNGDGHVDPVVGEAGALTAFLQSQLMATLSLTPSA